MINYALEILILLKYPLFFLFLIFLILAFLWKNIFQIYNLKSYNQVQRIHASEIPRLGGAVIYLFFWATYIFDFFKDDLFFNILISSIPFVTLSVKEDLFHNTTPKQRLISMIVSCLIFFCFNPFDFPIIDIPLIGKLISFYPINLLFFSFAVLVVMNGTNLIDGTNGLFGLTVLIQIFSLSYLAIILNDYQIYLVLLYISIPLVLFIFFNFPYGKIFIGDTGAYFFGFVNSIMCIYIFGKYTHLLSWLAILILFYPCIELLFSFCRKKIFESKSPFSADNRHLHTLIYRLIKTKTSLSNNSFVLFFLSPLPVAPILLIFFYDNLLAISLIIAFLSTLYMFTYFYIYKLLD